MAIKANSKPCQTSEMELFSRRRYWPQRRTQNLAKHVDGTFCKNKQELKVVHYLCKNLHLGCLTSF